jgi:pilus assembly protein CpaF
MEVAAVEDMQGGADAAAFTITELFRRAHPDAPLQWTGVLPVRMARSLEMAGFDVRALLDAESTAP